jgi:hypothetical protein
MACNPNPVKTEAEGDIATTIPQNPVVGAGGRLSAPTNTTVFVGANHGYLDATGAINSLMKNPKGVDMVNDGAGILFADNGNNLVRVLLPATRRVYTVAGDMSNIDNNKDGTGWSYDANGNLLKKGRAGIIKPTGVCAGPSLKSGNIANFYIIDSKGAIRRISYSGGSNNNGDLKLLNNVSFDVTTLPNIQFKNPTDITCDWQGKKLYVVDNTEGESSIYQISLNTTAGTATLNTTRMSYANVNGNPILKGIYFDNINRTGLYLASTILAKPALTGFVTALTAPGSWNMGAGLATNNVKVYYGNDIVSDPYDADPNTKKTSVLTCHGGSTASTIKHYNFFDKNNVLKNSYSDSYSEDLPQYLTITPGNSIVVGGVSTYANFQVFSTVFGTKSTINLNPDLIP